ncbi:MAG: glycosyltransferase, partial [Myxococcales bacterium]
QTIREARKISRFDVILIASFWQLMHLPFQLAATRACIPVVISPRGSLYRVLEKSPGRWPQRLLFWLVISRIMKRASAIHITADVERADLEAIDLGVPSFKVPNPFVTEKYAAMPTQREGRARFALPEDVPVILYLGRLDRRKGIDLLIDALSDTAGSQPGAILVLAGPDFDAEKTLRAQVKRAGLESRVRFTGLVDPEGRAALFAASDLCALTPYGGENFGNAAAEALAAGLPVLLSDQTGAGEHVEEFRAGLVVSPERQAVSAALASLLEDRDALAVMGQSGPRLVSEHYAADIVASMMARAFQDLLESNQSEGLGWQESTP